MKKMKAARFAQLLTIGLVLSLSIVGCRKGPQRTTTIPGRGTSSIVEKPGGPIDLAPPLRTDTGPGRDTTGTDLTKGRDIAATPRTFDGWNENRTEFQNQTVHFDFDKSIVKASELPKLEEVARRMKSSFQGKALRIEGHCDERGTEEYNRSLGDRRALSIREKLVQLGLDPEMLPTISFGEEKPVDPGHNEAAWGKNRRGELILLSPPGS
jgi:outer membrane protein OmpA-like peptidoglycan-associated protein